MGGYGSGRHRKRHLTTEMRSLDVRDLQREGCLEPEQQFTWPRGTYGMVIATAEGKITLNYHNSSSENEDIDVELDSTPCHFGGSRPWFRCPCCQRRSAIIYYDGLSWGCRICHSLGYPGENEKIIDRLYRKAWKLRARLDAPRDMTRPILNKPVGMHWDTFMLLANKAQETERQVLNMWGRQLGLIQ